MESKRGNVSILYPSCKCQVNDLYITCEFARRLLGRGTRQFTDKTVRRHNFSRQFPDRIGDNSPTTLETVHLLLLTM